MYPKRFSLTKTLVVSFFALFAGSCGYAHTYPNDHVVPNFCNTATSYDFEEAYSGTYKGYHATIHSQVYLDKNQATATDVAKMAWAVKMASEQQWIGDYSKERQITNMLKTVHVIVARDNNELQRMWGHTKTRQRLNGRMGLTEDSCFKPFNDTFFFTIRSERMYKKDMRTVSHEMMHAVSLAITNKNDADDWHANPEFWEELSEDSLESKALKIYYNSFP